MIEIHQYTPDQASRWNDFVVNSRNGTFLHCRGYMDYHADRFSDFSLIATDSNGLIFAVLPACRVADELFSHAGLTFAGWIMGNRTDVITMLEVMQAAMGFLSQHGIRRLIYKAVPYIYTSYPAEEDVYALLRAGATIERSMISSAVDLAAPLPFDMSYRQDVRRVHNLGLTVSDTSEESDWIEFWQLLTSHLQSKFNTAPVHTLAEISLLRSRFPANIHLYTARKDNELLGGVVVYHSRTAAHSQYTALAETGRRLRVLPAIHARAMEAAAQMGERYFDFGTSADVSAASGLNRGLIGQKIASGARGVLYTTYTLSF